MPLEKIMASIGLDGSSFEIGAKRVESTAARVGENISHHLKGAIMGAIGVAAIEEAVRHTIEFGARVNDLSKRLGMTAEKFQELSYAFKSTGGSEEGMVSFLERLSASRDKALAGTVASASVLQNFARLGISQEALKTKRNDELMAGIGEKIKDGDIQNLISPLRSIGGRGAGEMVAGFKAGLLEKAHEARVLGLIVSNEIAFAMKQIEEHGKNLTIHLMSSLAPAIVWAMDRLEDLTDHLKQFGAWLGGLTSTLTIGNLKKEINSKSETRSGAEFGALGITGTVLKAVGSLIGKGHDAALDALIEENEKIVARREEEDKRKKESNTPPKPYVDTSSPFLAADKFKTINEKQIPIDSLQKIGGFVGVGAEMPMVNIAREQLVELKAIAKNTTPKMASSTYDDSMVDEP